jgi:hypothetical protein
MKILERHWDIGPYSTYTPGDVVRVHWDLVREEAMTELERQEDDRSEIGHASFTSKFTKHLDDRFKTEGKGKPPIKFAGKLLLFALQKRYPFLPGLMTASSSEEIYLKYPDLKAFVMKNGTGKSLTKMGRQVLL